ncbi:MAG: hypothetical protein NC078_08570 [Ruminococcus sp.]|nr:hypothetical protein [Ruminococcus sp.]
MGGVRGLVREFCWGGFGRTVCKAAELGEWVNGAVKYSAYIFGRGTLYGGRGRARREVWQGVKKISCFQKE